MAIEQIVGKLEPHVYTHIHTNTSMHIFLSAKDFTCKIIIKLMPPMPNPYDQSRRIPCLMVSKLPWSPKGLEQMHYLHLSPGRVMTNAGSVSNSVLKLTDESKKSFSPRSFYSWSSTAISISYPLLAKVPARSLRPSQNHKISLADHMNGSNSTEEMRRKRSDHGKGNILHIQIMQLLGN